MTKPDHRPVPGSHLGRPVCRDCGASLRLAESHEERTEAAGQAATVSPTIRPSWWVHREPEPEKGTR